MYIVMFTAMLLSIIALSFVRIMLSESQLTTNYSLSQSAYNSAMAGVEDAKVILLKYQNCQSTNGRVGRNECERIADAIEKKGAEEDCDVIRKAHDADSTEKETLIISSESSSTSVESAAKAIDQAYTCVKINTESPDYLAKLNQNNPSKIVPIRVREQDDNGNGINEVNRIVIQWFSNTDVEKLTGGSTIDTHMYRLTTNSTAIAQTRISQDAEGAADYSVNDFKGLPSVAPYLKVELFQTAKQFGLNQFYVSDGLNTNRGTLTFRPSSAKPNYDSAANSTHIPNNDTTGFAASARKNYNFPMDVNCVEFNADGTVKSGNSDYTYACTADIVIPSPVKDSNVYDYSDNRYYRLADTSSRNPTSMFLRISLPYRTPETTVRTVLKHCASDTVSIGATGDDGCETINFFGVQPMVDSTGRANDLFRRVEARLEMVNTYFPYPDSALSVTGDDGLHKEFWVTHNCFAQSTTLLDDGTIKTKTYLPDISGLTNTDIQEYEQCYNSGGQQSLHD